MLSDELIEFLFEMNKELFVVTCCTIYHKRVNLKILLDISKSIYSTSQNGIYMGAGGGGHVNSI
jgi:hypothetical protein